LKHAGFAADINRYNAGAGGNIDNGGLDTGEICGGEGHEKTPFCKF